MKVICDSAVQLEYPTLKKLNLDIVEYPMYLNGEDYPVSIAMSREDKDKLRDILKDKNNVVTTSGLRSRDLLATFQKFKNEKIIMISQAGKASTATSQAIQEIVKDHPDLDIEYIDTHHLTAAHSVIVQQIAEAVIEGDNFEKLKSKIPSIRDNTRHMGAVYDLFYLHRTGRIGFAKALMGTAMKIIALLGSTDEPGMLKSIGKVKNYKQANQRFIQQLKKDMDDKNGKSVRAVITVIGPHEKEAEDLKNNLEKLDFPVKVEIHYTNHSNMPHAGPDFYDIGYTVHAE